MTKIICQKCFFSPKLFFVARDVIIIFHLQTSFQNVVTSCLSVTLKRYVVDDESGIGRF